VPDDRVRTRRDGIELLYDTPTVEFAASVLMLDGEHLGHEVDAPARHDGPQVLVCTEGSVIVRTKSEEIEMHRGEAAWVAADDGPIRVEATQSARLFRATVGL
jgi:mannose-6-phosphate isomerase